jgi:hypothetical protein
MPSTVESILLAELNVGLPPFTFYKLIGESSDWSFVLKLHAILECALDRLLRGRLSGDDFDDRMTFYRRVELAFDIPEFDRDDHYRNFFFNLNSLRNRFAHRAKYIVADIGTVVRDFPDPKRSRLIQSLAVGFIITGTSQNDPRNIAPRRELFSKWPRITILNSAGYALEMVSIASYIRSGKSGDCYIEDFRPQLQDLLLDPVVIEMRRKIATEFPHDDAGSVEG